jgi:U5 small nuclear ribonucleoprotein component
MVGKFESAKDAGPKYIKDQYLKIEEQSTQLYNKLLEGSTKGPLCINILKQYYNEKQGDFGCYGRIVSGTISRGQAIKVLGEKFTPEEQEDMVVTKAKGLYLIQ